MQKEHISQYILSDRVINEICSTGRWSHHGSELIYLFEDLEQEESYGDSRLRKKIVKDYIESKIEQVFEDIELEQNDKLYRAIYVADESDIDDGLGVFWSSNPNTAPCVSREVGHEEYRIEAAFDSELIDWEQTMRSRIDYIHGDREMEYQLFPGCQDKLSGVVIEKM